MKNIIIALALILLPFCLLATQHPHLIDSVQVAKNLITITPAKSFTNQFLKTDTLTYEYDSTVDLNSLDESIITIPFIVSSAPAIWVTGKTFSVESIDMDLYCSLKRLKEAFKLFYPTVSWDGEIIPQRIVKNEQPNHLKKSDIALLFSGGVDSTGSSFGNIDKKQLLITNHGIDKNFADEKAWNMIKNQCNQFAQTYGHSTAFIKFNYRRAFKESSVEAYCHKGGFSWFHHVAHSLWHLSTTAPLLFIKGYDKLYIGSSFTSDYPYAYGSHPLIDNNLSFCSVKIYHDQDDLTRPQKIMTIARETEHLSLPNPSLRVCWFGKNADNCLKCEKCLRTTHAILCQGLNPKYFDLPTTLNSLKKKTQEFLDRHVLNQLWEWSNSQNETKKNLASAKFRQAHNNELISYLEWFASLDLRKYCNKNNMRSKEEMNHSYFDILWQQGTRLKEETFVLA